MLVQICPGCTPPSYQFQIWQWLILYSVPKYVVCYLELGSLPHSSGVSVRNYGMFSWALLLWYFPVFINPTLSPLAKKLEVQFLFSPPCVFFIYLAKSQKDRGRKKLNRGLPHPTGTVERKIIALFYMVLMYANRIHKITWIGTHYTTSTVAHHCRIAWGEGAGGWRTEDKKQWMLPPSPPLHINVRVIFPCSWARA